MKFKLLVPLILYLLTTTVMANNDVTDKHINVAMRMIGDEFLKQIGDSTSRILPIKKVGDRYQISFEKEFGFEPDLLSLAAFKIVEETDFIEQFVVESEKCSTGEVVHSFEVNGKKDASTVPCKARALPKDCYQVYITILDQDQQPVKARVDSYANILIAFSAIFILFGFIIYWRRNKSKKTLDHDYYQIGDYQFDKKGMKLIFKGNSEELSGKEVDLLDLLYTNLGDTLERDYLLNKVWGDEGDYVGRTLDVFISKLRKKLEKNPSIKIINVRGVGYRLVVD